jgi:glycosyltransferase involved in cell wall biosynthesis
MAEKTKLKVMSASGLDRPKTPSEAARVCQILYSGLGGHGSVAFSLIDADANGEWQPVMGFFGIEPLLPAYAQACVAGGIPFEYFPACSGKSWRAWPRIFRWLRRCRPQAIVLHSVTALLPCFIYARLRGAPLVVVEHQSNGLKTRFDWLFSYLSMVLAGSVVVLTPAYAVELRKRLGLFYRARKVRIIPNGIDTARFAPASRPVKEHGVTRLGMAARFTSSKRQDMLVEMMAVLREREPSFGWRLSLAGDGDVWEKIRRTVLADGLEACVSLPGQLDEAELIEWYKSLDIYLHASKGETLSTAILQAMASGLPIVASDVPGIRSLVGGESACGILVADQSPEGFADAVLRLVEEPATATNFAENSRRIAVSSYGHERMFSEYNRLIASLDDRNP